MTDNETGNYLSVLWRECKLVQRCDWH